MKIRHTITTTTNRYLGGSKSTKLQRNRKQSSGLTASTGWPKYAFLVSYTGTYFYGVQLQARVLAIQNVIWEAMKNLKCAKKFSELGMHFASRTDRGVHALRNLLIMKLNPQMLAKYGTNEQFCQVLQQEIARVVKTHPILPGRIVCASDPERHIVIHGMKLVPDNLCGINSCKARRYMYLIPKRLVWPTSREAKEECNEEKHQRIMSRLNHLFKLYEGSHSFHNFAGGEARKCYVRNMYSIQLDPKEPFRTFKTEQFYVLKLYGEGFMKHHIRGMIGLVVAVMQNLLTEDVITKALNRDTKITVPEAPGIQLILEKQEFEDGSILSDDWGQQIEQNVEQISQIILEEVIRYDKEVQSTSRFLSELRRNDLWLSPV